MIAVIIVEKFEGLPTNIELLEMILKKDANRKVNQLEVITHYSEINSDWAKFVLKTVPQYELVSRQQHVGHRRDLLEYNNVRKVNMRKINMGKVSKY